MTVEGSPELKTIVDLKCQRQDDYLIKIVCDYNLYQSNGICVQKDLDNS